MKSSVDLSWLQPTHLPSWQGGMPRWWWWQYYRLVTGLYILLYFTECHSHLYCVIWYILYCPTTSEIPWNINCLHGGKIDIFPHVEYLKEPYWRVWNYDKHAKRRQCPNEKDQLFTKRSSPICHAEQLQHIQVS